MSLGQEGPSGWDALKRVMDDHNVDLHIRALASAELLVFGCNEADDSVILQYLEYPQLHILDVQPFVITLKMPQIYAYEQTSRVYKKIAGSTSIPMHIREQFSTYP